MFLQLRTVRNDDLEECFRSIRNLFAFADSASQAGLLQLWRTLLADGRMIGAIIEDISAPAGERIMWLCFKVFINEEFAEALRNGQTPPVPSRLLLDAYCQKQVLPLLTLGEIRRINSEPTNSQGLTMLVTHYGSPYVLGSPGRGEVVAAKLLAFTEYFSSGYHVREILQEFYDEYNAKLATNAGFCPRTRYEEYYSRHPLPDGQRPILLGTNAKEAAERPGTIAAAVFQYQRPQFFFRSGEQEMLLYALLGESDEDLAARLHIAVVTVRKRWDAIYSRIQMVSPKFFPESTKSDIAKKTKGRGLEKKRYLLSYLQHHMEELRPLDVRNETLPTNTG